MHTRFTYFYTTRLLIKRLLVSLIGCGVPLVAVAQQTIFNVPSADVTEKGSVFYQHQTGLRTWNPNRNWTQTHSFGYGLSPTTDLNVTVSGVVVPNTSNASVAIGSKTSIPLVPQHEVKLTLGQLYPIAVQENGHVGYWWYGHLSGRLPKTETRLTAGYYLADKVLFGKASRGVMLAVEQPVNKRLMLQADWFSGNNDNIFLIPGAVVTLANHCFLSLGYAIPTASQTHKKGAFILELTLFKPNGNVLRK